MAYSGNVPNHDINLYELGESLNAWGGSIDPTRPHTFFTEDANLNMWSRFKPVHIANTDEPDRTSEWWRGTDGDCGVSYGYTASNYANVKTAYDSDDGSGKNGWAYRLPSGGTFSPLRLGDFQYYYPNAQPPFAGLYYQTSVQKGNDFGVSMDLVAESDSGESLMQPGSLLLSDLQLDDGNNGYLKASNCYLGLLVYDSSGNYKGMAAGNGEDNYTCYFSTSSLTAGSTYNVYPFISNQKIDQDGSASSTERYYSIPKIPVIQMTVTATNPTYSLEISASYIGSDINTGFTYEVRLTNGNSSASITVSGSLIYYYSNRSWTDNQVGGEGTITLASQTIAAGAMGTWTGTVYFQNATYENQEHRIYVNFPSISVNQSTDIEISEASE